jgi:hypothetical protein
MLLKTVTLTAEAMMSRECGQDRGDKACTQKFQKKISWKMFTWKTKKDIGGHHYDVC